MVVTYAAVDDDFTRLAAPYRRELLAHCYRMLGSVQDAEDLVQETYLRAWRSYDRFEGRSSLRTWLYRIATRACLTALDQRSRRPLPTGLGGPTADPTGTLAERTEVPWLEPVPDAALGDPGDPAAIAGSREGVRLAFVAAMQHLTPRQRAVLVLRDVLKWKAAEVAEALETTPQAVNSILQRARTQLAQLAPAQEEVAAPTKARERDLLDRFVAALEAYDVPAIVKLLTADVVWEMPPYLDWVRGPADVGRLIGAQCPAERPGDMRLVPTAANGQPAYGVYMRDAGGRHRAFGIFVVTVTEAGISHVVAFFDPRLFAGFGLPDTYAEPAAAEAGVGVG